MTDAALMGPASAPDLHVMSFNLRRRMTHVLDNPDRWERRSPALAALLQSEQPALLGAQEAMPSQARFARSALGPTYRFVGRGRNADGEGEGCPLFYDSSRLELLEWSQLALSDDPTTAGSRSWGNVIPRILVRATFRDRQTSAQLLAINTHFDHLSRRSRVRSAEQIRSMVASQSLPAIVMGDLNSGNESLPLEELFRDDQLRDAWLAATSRVTAEWGTFPNYRKPRYNRKRIDWIAVTPNVEVVRAGINSREFAGVWPSDHLPVQVVVRLPE